MRARCYPRPGPRNDRARIGPDTLLAVAPGGELRDGDHRGRRPAAGPAAGAGPIPRQEPAGGNPDAPAGPPSDGPGILPPGTPRPAGAGGDVAGAVARDLGGVPLVGG